MNSDCPPGWLASRLGHHVEVLPGFAFKSAQFTDDNQGIRLLRGDNVAQGRLRWNGARRWSSADRARFARYELARGDVVIAMDRPWIEAGLKYAVIRADDVPSLLVQRVARLRAREPLDQRFLATVIEAPGFTSYVRAVHTGTAVPHISADQITDYLFPLPPLNEQRRIASTLDALGNKSDSNRKLVALLEQTAQAQYRARLVDHVGTDELVSSELGPIPAGWTIRSFGELGQIRGGGTPMTSEPSYWTPDEIVWLTPTDMSALNAPVVLRSARRISRAGLERSAARLLPAGTVVYTSRATIGLVAIARIELATNQGFINITPHPEFSAEFVFFTVQAARDEVMRRANGATFLEINKSNFKAIRFPCPSMNERAHLDDLFTQSFREIETLTRESETLAQIRDALLPKLVSGQIRVPDTTDPEEVVGPAAEELVA